MLIPFKVDVPEERWPIANYLIILINVLMFIWQSTMSPDFGEHLVLKGWGYLPGIIGSVWIHGSLMHLFGNMLFLWVFGNAVCAKVGNKRYFICYLILGFFATTAYLIVNGAYPCLGASGAVNGVVGMYLVLFYRNSISCLLFLFPFIRIFSVSSFWIILYGSAFDIIGLLMGSQGIAYWAHLGGLVGGFLMSSGLLEYKFITMDRHEESIFVFFQNINPFNKDKIDQAFEEIKINPELQWPTVSQDTIHQRVKGESDEQLTPEPIANMHTKKDKTDMPSTPPPATIRFSCRCGKVLKVPIMHGGQSGICPKCNKKVDIPIE